MKRFLYLVTIAWPLFYGVAHAQSAHATPCDPATPNNAFCITGTQDGKATDGRTITGVTFRVEQKFGTGTFATVASALTTLKYYAQNLAPGDYTWRVYATCTSVPNVYLCAESVASNATPGNVPVPTVTPNAPVIIIAATIRANGPPTYRIIQSVTLKPNEVVFAAPASMRPLFASR